MHSACFNRRTHTGCGHAHLLHAASIFCFNPRTTQGATFWVVPCIVIMLVSIHAHTQGATLGILQTIAVVAVSIHAPTQGATLLNALSNTEQMFQSTHPHGVRLRSANIIYICGNVSIHAPTRGATVYSANV